MYEPPRRLVRPSTPFRPSTAATARRPSRCAACSPKAGLIRERIRVEAQWLLHLAAAVPQLAGAAAAAPRCASAPRQLAREPGGDAAAAVKAIEARINHDVKAVEYYVREQLARRRRRARRRSSWCTSAAPPRTSTT